MFNKEDLPTYNQTQIDELNQKNPRYCLVILFGVVYNLYKFSSEHPGGEKNILYAAGEILDDIVTDGNHHLNQKKIEKLLGKYKFGLFANNDLSSNFDPTPDSKLFTKL